VVLGSLLDNKLRTCPSGHILKAGEQVKIIKSWKTFAREYWYVEVEYIRSGKVLAGWVQSGWKEQPWGYVRPNTKEQFQSV